MNTTFGTAIFIGKLNILAMKSAKGISPFSPLADPEHVLYDAESKRPDGSYPVVAGAIIGRNSRILSTYDEEFEMFDNISCSVRLDGDGLEYVEVTCSDYPDVRIIIQDGIWEAV